MCFNMKVIDIYEYSLYLRPKMVPEQKHRNLCTGAEIRVRSAEYMCKAFLDTVALITFTATGKSMLDLEADNSWRTFFPEWVEELERRKDGKKGLKRKTYSQLHNTEVDSKALIIVIFILLSYHPMYAYDSPTGTVEYTTLLNDFLKMYGHEFNMTHEKNEIVEQRPEEILSDFLFFCILMNTMNCLKATASKGKFSYLVRILKKNIETYHKYFVGSFKVCRSDQLSDDLIAFKKIDKGSGQDMTYFTKTQRKRYQMFCELLVDMTSEDFDKVESVFKELFKFKASEKLEEKLNEEMSSYSVLLSKASQNRIESVLNPLENMEYYINVVDSDDKKIADEIIKKFFR